ncbi:MAG: hypothetical protein LBF97_00490 [Elusimicrobiota bacterium]|jgi:hypothetical protein|nr:hypothetical protein [Elusimicrobiota bacterium]
MPSDEIQEETQNWNYIDWLQSSSTRTYQSSLLDKEIQTQGRLAYIFLYDKAATAIDEVYNTEKISRVYLPHFSQRSQYKTNTWTAQLNLNIYEEQEQNLVFSFNFDRMVQNIRSLKDRINGTIIIQNKRKTPITLKIENNHFILLVEENILLNENISKYQSKHQSVKKFINWLNNNVMDIKFSYEGNDDIIDTIKTKAPVLIQRGKTKKIDIKDSTYENSSDVIENGCVIITDRYKAYQVLNAYPQNDSFGSWLVWNCESNLIDLSKIDGIPNSARKLMIEKNRYNLPKNKLE